MSFVHSSSNPLPVLRLGQLVATPGAIRALSVAKNDPAELIARHRCGDWGDVSPDDSQANNDALIAEGRILSAYLLHDSVRIWVITEADRTLTTMLLPQEY